MGYAVQWFAFAIILVVGYIAFIYTQTKRGPSHPKTLFRTYRISRILIVCRSFFARPGEK